MNKLIFILLCFVLVFCNSSCKKFDEVQVSDFDAEYAIPLVNTKTTIGELMNNLENQDYFTIDPDGLITLNFLGNIEGRTSTEIFEAISQLNGALIPIPDTLSAIPFEFPNGLQIDIAELKSGSITWGYEADYEEDITVVVTIPSATLNGQILRWEKSHVWTGTPWTIFETSGAVDLTGYTIAPVDGSFEINYYALRDNGAFRDTLKSFSLFFQEMEASYMEGYLGNSLYEFERDLIEIDFFENWAEGDIYFEEPQINVTVFNAFGFPVRSLTNIANIITVNSDTLALDSEFVAAGNGIYFNYPTLSEVGEVAETFFSFDKDNSNIQEILGAGPIAFDYDIDALANPDMDTTIRGFLTDTSFFRFQLEIVLPFYGKAKGFEVFDTVSIDFSEYNNFEYAEFKVIAENELALDIGMQFYFMKADGSIIDSLFENTSTLIEGAEVDGVGNAQEVNKKTTFVPLEGARFDRIKESDNIIVKASFSTINNGETSVKVLADQGVAIRMGMKVGVKN